MRRVVVFAGLAAITMALAGCETAAYAPMAVRPQAQNGIEGNWIDPNGIVSTFRGGTFETRTTDTNSVLATGTYTYVSDRMAQIDMHSLLRNTNSTVNCVLVSPTQLNCTSSGGAQFSLNRAAGMVGAAG